MRLPLPPPPLSLLVAQAGHLTLSRRVGRNNDWPSELDVCWDFCPISLIGDTQRPRSQSASERARKPNEPEIQSIIRHLGSADRRFETQRRWLEPTISDRLSSPPRRRLARSGRWADEGPGDACSPASQKTTSETKQKRKAGRVLTIETKSAGGRHRAETEPGLVSPAE